MYACCDSSHARSLRVLRAKTDHLREHTRCARPLIVKHGPSIALTGSNSCALSRLFSLLFLFLFGMSCQDCDSPGRRLTVYARLIARWFMVRLFGLPWVTVLVAVAHCTEPSRNNACALPSAPLRAYPRWRFAWGEHVHSSLW